jgi:hypothetical protein
MSWESRWPPRAAFAATELEMFSAQQAKEVMFHGCRSGHVHDIGLREIDDGFVALPFDESMKSTISELAAIPVPWPRADG